MIVVNSEKFKRKDSLKILRWNWSVVFSITSNSAWLFIHLSIHHKWLESHAELEVIENTTDQIMFWAVNYIHDFRYWISPDVRLTVCIKRTSQSYPNFDFCTNPIRGGSPGPAQITIDNFRNEPFQVLFFDWKYVESFHRYSITDSLGFW